MRNRNFRRMFGMGRRQMANFRGIDQYGKPLINRAGFGRNQGDKPGSGPGGKCVCPECGHTIAHTVNNPCNQIKCPDCGITMTKE